MALEFDMGVPASPVSTAVSLPSIGSLTGPMLDALTSALGGEAVYIGQ